jgi:hypothetical protein
MAGFNDLQAWFKVDYADKLKDLTPDFVYYAKEIPALPSDQQPGGYFTQPVTLTSEQGVTFASSRAGAFALNSPIDMLADNAIIEGSQCLIRSALDYESIFRSKNKNSFIAVTKGKIQNMIKSAYLYLEANIMWGRSGIGVVSSIGTNTIVITTASYAPGFWLGSEKRRIRIESAAGVLRGSAAITSWDIEARTVTVDSAPAGIIATDIIYFDAAGAAGANEMIGMYNIMNPANTTMFGINGTNYGLWMPSTAYDCGAAPISFNKIMLAVTRAGNRGLGDDISEIDVTVSPYGWQNLANDLAALRMLDSSYKTSEASNGSEKITFTTRIGKVSVRAHKMMKEGFAFIHPKASRAFVQVGNMPVPTFELPGMVAGKEGTYLRPMENNAGVESRIYWNSSVFTATRSHCILMTNIVNATT